MSKKLLPNLKQRYFDNNGDPLAGGKLYSYIAGTATPLATYTDPSGLTANTNPVILDANGEADIWIGNDFYKFILTDANDVTQFTQDDVTIAEDVAAEAAASATESSGFADDAEASSIAASGHAWNASNSATAAATSATASSTSATASSTSATASSTSATNSATSATASAGSATTASTQATNSATSATASAGSATTASNHKTTASRWATYTSGTVIDADTLVNSGEYSAKKYAQDAATSAASAASLDVPTLVTTKGDLLSRTSSALARLPVGSNGLFLKADSTQTTGLIWASTSGNLAVSSKTTAYTLTTSDDMILADATSAAFTLTLPTAVGNTGKVFRLKKIDSTANLVTIATTSSQTIDGATTDKLPVRYDSLTLISDGANWDILTRDFAVSYLSALTATPASSNGTSNWLTITGNYVNLPANTTWVMSGTVGFSNGGTSPSYTQCQTRWATTPGANNTTIPTAVVTDAGDPSTVYAGINSSSTYNAPANIIRASVTAATAVYLVPRPTFSGVAANTSITVTIYAERMK